MRYARLLCLAVLASAGGAAPLEAAPNRVDKALLKLGPDERAKQACVIKGIEQLRHEKRITKPDFLSPGVSKPAAFDGSVVTAPAGAVRANHKWYQLAFTCAVSKDLMKAESFSYTLGAEIPKAQWADLGLWE